MKRIFCIFAAALLCGCTKVPSTPVASKSETPMRWEYKVVEVDNFEGEMKADAHREMLTNAPDWLQHSRAADSASGNFVLNGSAAMGKYGAPLYDLGYDGWELVSAIPQTETIPDAEKFHGQDFIAGKLQDGYTHFSNIRTGKIILIFKRPAK